MEDTIKNRPLTVGELKKFINQPGITDDTIVTFSSNMYNCGIREFAYDEGFHILYMKDK